MKRILNALWSIIPLMLILCMVVGSLMVGLSSAVIGGKLGVDLGMRYTGMTILAISVAALLGWLFREQKKEREETKRTLFSPGTRIMNLDFKPRS